MPLLSIAEYDRFLTLERRVAAVEAQLAERESRQSEPLKRRNAARVAAGQQLRDRIAAILATHPGPGQMSAKHVLNALAAAARAPLPSLRTVRWHMAQIRGNGNTAALPPR